MWYRLVFIITVNVGIALQCLCNLGVTAVMIAVRGGSKAGAFHQCDVVDVLCELHAVCLCISAYIMCGEILI